MKLHSAFIVAGIALAAAFPARAASAGYTIRFSDEAKPGTLRINAGRNAVTVRGADDNDIRASVKGATAAAEPARKDGLRVLNPAYGFSLSEKDNLAVLDATPRRGNAEAAGAIEVTVPRRTSVIIRSDFDADIAVSDLSGDVEVRSTSGDVDLKGLRGAATVETMRGAINAAFVAVPAGKRLSFSSLSGPVVVTVPRATKASVRLRTQNGTILSDFSDSELAVRSEPASGSTPFKIAAQSNSSTSNSKSSNSSSNSDDGVQARAEEEGIRRQAEEEARLLATRGRELEIRARDMARDIARDGRAVINSNVFSFTGGQVIIGTLNGGGPEIAITTLNSDMTLRKGQ